MGLMDYKARFYSPGLGRFIQPDSIIPNPSNPQAWNRFSYVMNRPVNFNDPSGHDSIINEFLAGVASEILSSIGWFSPQVQQDLAPDKNESIATLAGRVVGDVVSMAIGVAAIGTGAGGITGGTLCVGLSVGGCLPAGAPAVAAGGVLVLEGAGASVRGAIGLGTNLYLMAKRMGRRGTSETRDQLDEVRDDFLKNNPKTRHVAGGRDAKTGQELPEEYIPGPFGGRKGSSFPDLTFEDQAGKRIRINTVDVGSNGQITPRELSAINRIFKRTGEIIIGIFKRR